jgi:thymidylate synthase (FAD)
VDDKLWREDVLDKGHLILVDRLGSDKTVVNAARISYANADWMATMTDAKDDKLIKYLATHRHVSTFYHPQLQFVCKAPISVQRQAFKHKIGTAENSESTRYTEVAKEFYLPDYFRHQSTTNKQGSGANFDPDRNTFRRHSREEFYEIAWDQYQSELKDDTAKEQARGVLPLDTYTSWFWTMSLLACVHFIELRDESGAQYEIRSYGQAMKRLVEPFFPVSMQELLNR